MPQAAVSADSLRAVLDTVFAAPAYDWVEQEHPFGWIERAWLALVDFLERLRAADPLIFRIGLAVLILALVAILAHASWIMLKTMRHAVARDVAERTSRPAERRDAAWFEREADRLAAAGRHVDALQAAFAGLTLRLDELGAVRYDPSRTPREYAREARLDARDRRRLQDLVTALYRHAFGGEPLGPEDYRRWRASAAGEWHGAAA
jgi:hypothetical protein